MDNVSLDTIQNEQPEILKHRLKYNLRGHSGINVQAMTDVSVSGRLSNGANIGYSLDGLIELMHRNEEGFETPYDRELYAEDNVKITSKIGLEEALDTFLQKELTDWLRPE